MFARTLALFTSLRPPVRALVLLYWIYAFAGGMVGVFVQVFLYQQFSSVTLNIIATLLFYGGIMLGFCIPGWVASALSLNSKHGYILSFMVMGGALVYLHSAATMQHAYSAMLLWGVGQGMFWLTVNTFELFETHDAERDSYSSVLNAGSQVLNLLGPACATGLIWLGDVLHLGTFSLLFVVAPAVFLLGFFCFAHIRDYHPPKLVWADVVHFFADRKSQWAQVYILGTGFQQTFTTTMVPLVMLTILGTALNVGLFETAFAVFSAVCLVVAARYRTPQNRLLFYGLALMCIIAATLWLGSAFTLGALVIYMVVVGVMGPLQNVSTHVIDLHVMEISRKETDFYATMLLRDFFLWVWRSLGGVVLLVLVSHTTSEHAILSTGLYLAAFSLAVMYLGAWLVLRKA